MDRRRVQGAASLLLIAVLLSGPLPAEVPPGPVTQDEAVALVRERVSGRILRVERLVRNERVQYRVRVLTRDGRVRDFVVDADTGRIR